MRRNSILMAAVLLVALSLPAQTVRTTRLAVAPRKPRPVPSLGVFMLAYESMQKGATGPNARLVSALQKVLNETPGAAEAFERLHTRYAALTAEQRAAIVGPFIAKATPETGLPDQAIEEALNQPSTRVVAARDIPVVWLTKEQIAAANRRSVRSTDRADTPEALDANHEPPGVKNIKAGLSQEVETLGPAGPMTQTLPKITIPPPDYFSVRFKGIFCSDEGSDWGSSSEPYVIFNMVQGKNVWTTKAGPYSGTDTGDNIYKDISLFDKGTLFAPLTVQVIMMENDSWNPSDLVKVIQAAASLVCVYETGKDCPTQVMVILNQVLDWFFALFTNDDDQVGPVQTAVFDQNYFKNPLHKAAVDHGFTKTQEMLCNGAATDDGRYWLFFEVRKVAP